LSGRAPYTPISSSISLSHKQLEDFDVNNRVLGREFLETMVREKEQGATLAGFAHCADNAHDLVFADDADQIGVEKGIAALAAAIRRGRASQ